MADEEFGQTQPDDDLDKLIEDHVEEDGGKETDPSNSKEEETKEEGSEKEPSKEETEDQEETVSKEETGDKKDTKENKDESDKDSEESTEEEEKSEIGIEDFNKVLESEYDSVDDLKDVLDQSKETDTLRKSVEEWKEKYEEKDNLLKEYSNPLSHFKDENEYKRQQLLKERPELNSQLAGELFSKDIDKMNDLDAIILKTQLETPGLEGGDEGVKELLYKKFGIDDEEREDPTMWSTLTKNEMKIESNQAKRFLKDIRDKVKLPETVDFEKQKEEKEKAVEEEAKELKQKWEPAVNKLYDSFDKLSLVKENDEGKKETFFEYEVDKDFKENTREEALQLILDSGLEMNEENLKAVSHDLRNQYFLLNRDKVMQAYADDAVAKNNEEWRKKTDSAKTPSDKEKDKPPATGEEAKNAEVDAEVEKDLKDEGIF